MMETWWLLTWSLVAFPVVGWLIWWWNELRYAMPVEARLRKTGKKLPPGNMGLPFFGELLTFLWYFKIVRRPDDFINSKRRRYGDGIGMFRTHMFGRPSIIAFSPAAHRFIFQSDDDFPYRWPTNDLMGHKSIISAFGHRHAKLKKFISSAINQPRALHNIALLIQPRIVASLASWVDRGEISAYDEVKKVIFQNIGKLFGSTEPGPLLDEIYQNYEGLCKGFRAHPYKIPGTAYYHALKCRWKLEGIFRKELDKRRKLSSDSADAVWNDLMDGLMQVQDENGKMLTDDEVVDNIVSLISGGFESATSAVTWAIYYLALYPDVLQKLREENMTLSKNKKGDLVTSEEISQLKYTSKVVEEIIRLANVSMLLFREGDQDVECQGYVIPKGWKVILWLRYIHTDPGNFDDPMTFNPDRWNQRAKPSTFLVFGGGNRICVGNMFARMQIAIFLHHLVVGYKWKLLNPDAKMIYLPHPKPEDGVKIAFCRI